MTTFRSQKMPNMKTACCCELVDCDHEDSCDRNGTMFLYQKVKMPVRIKGVSKQKIVTAKSFFCSTCGPKQEHAPGNTIVPNPFT